MKLTAELIASRDTPLNALKDRELSLRGLKIPAIENLGATQDLNDLLDLTDNDIRSLSNFPLLKRLTTLYAANNLISRVDPRIAHSLPYLHTLVLTNNPLEPNALADVAAALAKFPFLEHLALMGSPLARQKHYREYLIWRCKKLRVIDFRRVKQAERALAIQLFETADGRPSALAASISSKATLSRPLASAPAGAGGGKSASSGTFEPGVALGSAGTGAAGRLLSAEEKRRIETAIQNASSLEEIKRLEEKLRLGYAIDEADLAPGGKSDKGGKAAKGKNQEEQEQEEEMDEED